MFKRHDADQGSIRVDVRHQAYLLGVFCLLLTPLPTLAAEPPWPRHTIDNSLQGADGVRLGDFNRDGLPDVATGWEESGQVSIYLNPGPDLARSKWRTVVVGKAKSPEDAIPIDLDGDGKLDVLSCHEGRQRQLLVHWNNAAELADEQLLDPARWKTEPIAQLDGQLWMYAAEMSIGSGNRAVVVGSKGAHATITLIVPEEHAAPGVSRRETSRWKTKTLRSAGWIMSLTPIDMDGDGDLDIVFSDRKGARTGAAWLEQPEDWEAAWREHPIAGQGREVMFLSASAERCLVGTRNDAILDCRRRGDRWLVEEIPHPSGVPLGKAVEPWTEGAMLLTSNTLSSNPPIAGFWLRNADGQWSVVDPLTKVKFDRMEVLDLDGDGDLDVMTCEERRNLGVIWYENPEK